MALRLFQIFDRMNVDDGDNKTSNLAVCSTLVSANYGAKQGGTVVGIGVPGNVAFDIEQGKKKPILLLINMEEYNRISSITKDHIPAVPQVGSQEQPILRARGSDLEFISLIRKDGSGMDPVPSGHAKTFKDEVFTLKPLSLSAKTWIASGGNTYVVKSKETDGGL